MKVGDIVKFKKILEPGDEFLRFDLVEHNGDRVLIRVRPTPLLKWNWEVLPLQQVVPTDDVELADD